MTTPAGRTGGTTPPTPDAAGIDTAAVGPSDPPVGPSDPPVGPSDPPIGPMAQRVVVEGEDPVILVLGPDDVPAGRRPDIRHVTPMADDRVAGRTRHEVTIDGWVFHVTTEPAARAALRERAAQAGHRSGPTGTVVVRAPIPGRVARLWTGVGDAVEAGQRLLAIEAMKMENEVRSPRAGTVVAVTVAAGAHVELGDELVRVE